MTISSTTSTFTRQGSGPADALQANIQGQVITPDDPRYEEARLAWNRTVQQRPALIVTAASAADVAEAVKFARAEGLGVAVQSTGHGVTLPADGALLILTSGLKELRVDEITQTAWLGAGLKWGEVLAETQRHGLAPLLGSSPGVGVVGYTLGGGYGWLGRKYGMAVDSVLAFELVSASGDLVRASATENADLYWGLRGGGGSFGVVTGMEIRLYPVDTVYGGNLLYPAADAREVMRRYRDWIKTNPDELTTSIVVMNFPPIPQIPEPLRGQTFVMVRGCYCGPVEEGEKMITSYWRNWKAPVMDMFGPMPFAEVAKISSDPVNPAPSHSTGAWVRALSDEAIDTLLQYALPQGGPPALTLVEVRHVGGAVTRVAERTNAFSRRDAELLLFAVGMAPTPEAHARTVGHAEQMKQALGPALTGGLYMNFVHGQEARARTKDGYTAEAYARLQEIKAAVDPEDTFRYSYDFAPKKE